MPCRQSRLFRLLGAAILCTLWPFSAQASTPLAQWSITATTGVTNTNAPVNYFPVFTASKIISGPNLYVGSPTSPSGSWNRTYTNSPNPIPYAGLQAISQGNYLGFNTVISAGAALNVDGISNLLIAKTASAATNAGLYYSIDGGSVWAQAGGTATLPLSTGIQDYSTYINTGSATNRYQTNGGIWNTGPYTTNSGLGIAPIVFDNSGSTNALTVDWVLAFWGAGNGRIGLSNGGNQVTLNGNIIAVPEASANALVCLSVLVLVLGFALVRAAATRAKKAKV